MHKFLRLKLFFVIFTIELMFQLLFCLFQVTKCLHSKENFSAKEVLLAEILNIFELRKQLFKLMNFLLKVILRFCLILHCIVYKKK